MRRSRTRPPVLESGLDGHRPSVSDASGAIQVLLIGRPSLLAESLGMVLATEVGLTTVAAVVEPAQAVEVINRLPPNVALVGLGLSGTEIVEALGRVRAAAPAVKTVVLSSALKESSLAACIEAGASGHLTEEDSLDQVADTIRRVHAGEVLFPADTLMDLIVRPRRAHVGHPLAPRELEVLRTLATGVTTDEAAIQLAISVHTVRTHLRNAMAKLNTRSKLEAIILALREGWIQLPD